MFNDTYCMDESNVYTTWKYVCEKNDNVIRVGMKVTVLVDMKDIYVDGLQIRGKVMKLLNVYVQSNAFRAKHAKCIYLIFLNLFKSAVSLW